MAKGVRGIVGRGGIRIYGDKEMDRALRKLGKKVDRKLSLAAVRVGARPIWQDAARRAPRQTGILGRSMGARTKKYRRGAEAAIAVIGARTRFRTTVGGYPRQPAFYAHLVAKGTRPHLLRYLRIGGQLIRQWWRHPGARPQPFLGPAFEANKTVALRKIRDNLRKGIEREAKKAAAR